MWQMLDVAPTKIIMKKPAPLFQANGSVATQTLGVKFGDGEEWSLNGPGKYKEGGLEDSFQSSGLLHKYPEVLLG